MAKIAPDADGRFPCEYGCVPAPGEPETKYRYRSAGGRGRHYYLRHHIESTDPGTIERRKFQYLRPNTRRRSITVKRVEMGSVIAHADRSGPLTPGEIDRLRLIIRNLAEEQLARVLDRPPSRILEALSSLAASRFAVPKRSLVNPINTFST